jgi:thiosulfate reductase cytochrome b subunit
VTTAAREAGAAAVPAARRALTIRRHSLVVRITHWINVACMLVLLLSGLQIFNAHPALYIGVQSDFDSPVLAMTARNSPTGPVGETHVLGHTFDTTGVLGLSTREGVPLARGFPSWLTLPSYQDLATGRRWHFLFAWLFVLNGCAYLIGSLVNRHLVRDVVPSGPELRNIGTSIWNHLRLRVGGERGYNVLQKLAYLALIFLAVPCMVLAGMTLSPGLDAAFPWLLDLFGGRQTARTIHFIVATLLVLFVVVHVAMVLVSGAANNLRSMITGRYAIVPREDEP